MIFLRQPFFSQHYRWVILIVIGLLGFVATAWVTREMAIGEKERLEQRFQHDAQEHSERIIRAFQAPLDQLTILQRLFISVGDVDWPVFEKFAEPMTHQVGVHGFAWVPLVDAAHRGKFELLGQALWGSDFSIRDTNGHPVMATQGERHYPVLYTLPTEKTRKSIGVDLYSIAHRKLIIDQAVDTGQPAASEVGRSPIFSELADDFLLLAVPVYQGVEVPKTPEERHAFARGVLLTMLNIDEVFDSANSKILQNGLHASLFDTAAPSRAIHRVTLESNNNGAQTLSGSELTYTRDFEVASRTWAVRIEAGLPWLTANRTNSAAYIPFAGAFLTLLLLIYLHRLLGRSELADSLKMARETDVAQRQAAEIWANKLAMAVEQNPATIIIHDREGRIEYVNNKFVETTHYSREEAIGQNLFMLAPPVTGESVYREMHETIAAGQVWRGDLQNRRRDGSLYWEHVLVSPIRNHEGTITNFVAIKENITQLREVLSLLQESESRFRGAMSVMAEGFAILSPEGSFIFGNRIAEELFPEFSSNELPGNYRVERLSEDGTPCLPENYPTNITLREECEVRDRVMGLRSTDGKVRWFQFNTSLLKMGEEQNAGVVVTFSEITERRHAEEQLKLAYEAIKHSSEGVMVTDGQHRILSINPALEKLLGRRQEEVLGDTPKSFMEGSADDISQAVHQLLEKDGLWQGEIHFKRETGASITGWCAVSAVRDAEGRAQHYVSIISDMTEREASQQHIEYLAHHDPLTGLPNRLLLRDRVDRALAQAARMQSCVALLFLDLDRFKTINDSLGHPVGDALLKEVVGRLKACVRESDTVSRQGGDEFIILLNDVRDSEAVSRVADKIHQRMGDPIEVGEHSLITSFSIGVALYPTDGTDFDSLLQKADTAMYHAKEAGRSGHRFFTEQMNQKVVEHLTLQTQLRHALENNEFVLHYQPQLDLHEGKIIGVEALIRWNNPENGLVPPGRFIPVAEDTGLIVPIGAWVISEACRQARAWQDAGLEPFVVAVNLSAVQFKRLDLVNTVINALVLSDLDSQWLELELTESILVQDAEITLDTVRRLKALGIKLSVDDFGTGYSSLAYLKRFAVDKLKIDQSFVRDLLTNPDDAAIIRAIVQMARSLKLKTIAEGVEREEIANLLRLFHCDEIQGYWFARPMPANELEAFVRKHQANGI